ncbi:helix-hairpin-helix domain-containing protein [Oceanobacter sp. 5_MG-2023]|nr:helix-hairpin-helix domain-containing protein [Oceanobacter sp. 5_MG-2023]MDO6683567.1 helix-hairpin-helix domain-containing protein [Oceanobacter sp. 5_MG-2023]
MALLLATSTAAYSDASSNPFSTTFSIGLTDLSGAQPPQPQKQGAALLAVNDSSGNTPSAVEATTTTAMASKININTASVDALTHLQGIGAVKAEAIVRYRQENGPFNSIEDLAQVRGIGSATIEKNRWLVTTQ